MDSLLGCRASLRDRGTEPTGSSNIPQKVGAEFIRSGGDFPLILFFPPALLQLQVKRIKQFSLKVTSGKETKKSLFDLPFASCSPGLSVSSSLY